MRFFLILALAACTRPADNITCDPGDVLCLRMHASDLGGTSGVGGTSATGGSSDLGTQTSVPSDLAMNDRSNDQTTLDLSTVVTTNNNPTGLGAACSGSCGAGQVCALSHGTRDVNICRQPCAIDGDCQQATFPGGLAPFCQGASAMTAGSCSISCNPVGASPGTNGCGAGLSCYAISDRSRPSGTVIVTDCVPPGASASGAFCNETPDCGPGQVCVNVLISQCYPLCNLADGVCPAGTTCTQFFNVSSQFGFCT